MPLIVRKASTFYGKIHLTNPDGDTVILSDGEQLIFSVKKSLVSDSPVLIRKSLHDFDQLNADYPFTLTPDETNLPSGTYFYDVALQCSNGEFYHVTMPEPFIVRETVARKESE